MPVLLIAGWLRFVTPREVEDLLPRPDAIEYEEAARSLAAGRGCVLELAGSTWPPRYPPGFPALLAASSPLVGTEPGFGTWVVQAAGLAAVVAAWLLASRAAGPWAGAVAAVIVAVSRLHVGWSRLVMSDVPSSAACGLVAAWFLAALDGGPRARSMLAVGVAAGAIATLRPTNLLLAVAMLAALVLRRALAAGTRAARRSLAADPSADGNPGTSVAWAGIAAGAVALAAGVALGLLPLAAWQWIRFGSPLASGYDEHLARVVPFSIEYALAKPGERGSEPNLAYYLRTLAGLGWGTLYAWPIGVLVALGVPSGARSGRAAARSLVVLAVAFAVATLAVHAPFFWQWDRFLLPLLPLLAAVAALAVISPDTHRARPAGVVLLGLGLLLNATREGAIRSSPLSRTPVGEAAELRLVDEAIERDAILVMRADPFLARRLLRSLAPSPGEGTAATPQAGRRLIGIGISEHESRVVRVPGEAPAGGWLERPLAGPFDRLAFRARIERLLREGRPVYLAASPRDGEVGFAAELHAAARADFETSEVARRDGFVLSRLRERGPAAAPVPPGP